MRSPKSFDAPLPAPRRWQSLRKWGTETAKRLGLKTEADLQRLLEKARARRRKDR